MSYCLPDIPSEFIEPYLKRFLMMQIESIAAGLETPTQVRKSLKEIEYFASSFCGIHAKFAVTNEYNKFCKLSDREMKSICKKVFED
jgi:hypothetical protein